jgi:mono/diheme cytochrome c family protein
MQEEHGMTNFVRTARFVWGLSLSGLLIVCLTSPIVVMAQEFAEDLYNHKCAVCHGKDGLGNTAKGKKVHVKDVHENVKDSEEVMIKAVTDGKGDDMDSYKKEFTPEQIKGLVDYYRGLGKK